MPELESSTYFSLASVRRVNWLLRLTRIGADGPATFIINFGEQPYLYIQAAEYSPAGDHHLQPLFT